MQAEVARQRRRPRTGGEHDVVRVEPAFAGEDTRAIALKSTRCTRAVFDDHAAESAANPRELGDEAVRAQARIAGELHHAGDAGQQAGFA